MSKNMKRGKDSAEKKASESAKMIPNLQLSLIAAVDGLRRLEHLGANGPRAFVHAVQELDDTVGVICGGLRLMPLETLEDCVDLVTTMSCPPLVPSGAWQNAQKSLYRALLVELAHRRKNQSPEQAPTESKSDEGKGRVGNADRAAAREQLERLSTCEKDAIVGTLRACCVLQSSRSRTQKTSCLLAEASYYLQRDRKPTKLIVIDYRSEAKEGRWKSPASQPDLVGTFHPEFWSASKVVSPSILKAFIDQGYDIILGGHGEGGAVATCLFFRFLRHFRDVLTHDRGCVRVVTFGSPPCATKGLSDRVRAPEAREAILNVVPAEMATSIGSYSLFGRCATVALRVPPSSETPELLDIAQKGKQATDRNRRTRSIPPQSRATESETVRTPCEEEAPLGSGSVEDYQHSLQATFNLNLGSGKGRNTTTIPELPSKEKKKLDTRICCERLATDDPQAPALYRIEVRGPDIEWCYAVEFRGSTWQISNRSIVSADTGEWVISGVIVGTLAMKPHLSRGLDGEGGDLDELTLWDSRLPGSVQAQSQVVFLDDPWNPGDALSDRDWVVCYLLNAVMQGLAVYSQDERNTDGASRLLRDLLAPITNFLYRGLTVDSFFEALVQNPTGFMAFSLVGAADVVRLESGLEPLRIRSIPKRVIDILSLQARNAAGDHVAAGAGAASFHAGMMTAMQQAAAAADEAASAVTGAARCAPLIAASVALGFAVYGCYRSYGKLHVDLESLSLQPCEAELDLPGFYHPHVLAVLGYNKIRDAFQKLSSGDLGIDVNEGDQDLNRFLGGTFSSGAESDWLLTDIDVLVRLLWQLDVGLRDTDLPIHQRQRLETQMRHTLQFVVRFLGQIADLLCCFFQDGRASVLDLRRGPGGRFLQGAALAFDLPALVLTTGLQHTIGLCGHIGKQMNLPTDSMRRQSTTSLYDFADKGARLANCEEAFDRCSRLRLFSAAFPGLQARDDATNLRSTVSSVVAFLEQRRIDAFASLHDIRDWLWPDGKPANWLCDGCKLAKTAPHDRLRVCVWLQSLRVVHGLLQRTRAAATALIIGPSGAGKSTLVANLVDENHGVLHGPGFLARSQFPRVYPVAVPGRNGARVLDVADVPGFVDQGEALEDVDPRQLMTRLIPLARAVVVVVNFQAPQAGYAQIRAALLTLIQENQFRAGQILICITHVEALYFQCEEDLSYRVAGADGEVSFADYAERLQNALDLERNNIIESLCGGRDNVNDSDRDVLRSRVTLDNTKFMITTFAQREAGRNGPRSVLRVELPNEEEARSLGIVSSNDVRQFLAEMS